MTNRTEIVCIGSVLWDVIGRAPVAMRIGSDVAGRITRLPGGVALNIAMTLSRFMMRPVLLSAVGHDAEGDELVAAADARGLVTEYLYRSADLPTDIYMAIEGKHGVVAAIADAHSLEAAGDKILAPLTDGRLATAAQPYAGPIALDGNLTIDLLSAISQSPAFAAADLRVAPASPGKAERLQPFLRAGRGTLYVNLEEANRLANASFTHSADAAVALQNQGASRVIVTNGGAEAAEAGPNGTISRTPPPVLVTQVTGAGDTFMAAHIASEYQGLGPEDAFDRALDAAASYVSGGSAA